MIASPQPSQQPLLGILFFVSFVYTLYWGRKKIRFSPEEEEGGGVLSADVIEGRRIPIKREMRKAKKNVKTLRKRKDKGEFEVKMII
jgi:hypothetical protein